IKTTWALLCSGRENRLEMRALVVTGDNGDVNVLEADGYQKLMELDFAEAKPVVGVKFAGAFESMAKQIEDHDAAALAQNPMGAGDGALGMDGVMQRLAENGEIDRTFRDRRVFDVAKAVFEISETVAFRELRSELDHLRRVIDRDDFARGLSEQLGKSSFARAKIGDGERGQKRDEGMSQCLPRAAGDVTAPEFSRQLVKIFPRFIASFSKRQLERGAIARGLRHFAREHPDQLRDFCPGRVPFLFRRQPVVNIFSRPPIFDDAGPFQLRQMTRDARLPHPENFLKLGYGKFVFLQEKEEAQPRWIGQELQKING